MTPKQAAKYLAVCERTLWARTNEGKVRCVRMGHSVRYRQQDLDAYVESCMTGADLEPHEAA